jgi:hypothetical protein
MLEVHAAFSECVEKWTIPERSSLAAAKKGGHEKMFYSDVNNPSECSVKKLSISWIVQKLNINERIHAWKRKCTITTRI